MSSWSPAAVAAFAISIQRSWRDLPSTLVAIRPGSCYWFARLFGARPELVDQVAIERWPGGEVRWRSATTGRDLREMRYGAVIREALERRPVGEVPAAIARPA